MQSFKKILSDTSRINKKIIMLCFDVLATFGALFTAYYLRTGEPFSQSFLNSLELIPIFLLVTIIVYIRIGLYRAIIRYMGNEAFVAVLKGVSVSVLTLSILVVLFQISPFPRSVFFLYWLMAVVYVAGSRYLMRQYFHMGKQHLKERAIIYGAGSAGHQLSVLLSHSNGLQPVCFVDDNPNLFNSTINGLNVFDSEIIANLIEDYDVDRVLIAMPSIPNIQRANIINRLKKLNVNVYTVPSIHDMANGKAKVDDIREVDINDLLGREFVSPNSELLYASVSNKCVMVTGAGGSIGSELSSQIVQLNATNIVLYEISEYALYEIESHIREIVRHKNLNVIIHAVLGDIKDETRLTEIIQQCNVDTIYHAAAYKHVPLVEDNIKEGIKNNIFGTLSIAKAAIHNNVKTFVLVSTDKAVRPTNIMGATKRYAEMILQALSVNQNITRFCMVRFGNVLGSSGSVIPLFQKQIKAGGPVTVTHPEITRYFMTITEAAQLVIQAGSMGIGGEVFVLDMGEPVKVDELARKAISLAGLTVQDGNNPNADIAIKYIGLRPGEKLYEELLLDDKVIGTEHPKIMKAEEEFINMEELQESINLLQKLINDGSDAMIQQELKHIVTGYTPHIRKQLGSENSLGNIIRTDNLH